MSRRTMTRRLAPAFGLVAFVAFVGVLISCESERGVLDPGEVQGPSFEVFDASEVGSVGFEDANPYFHFLSPLVKDPLPTGTFDPEVEVLVKVIECHLGPGDLVNYRRLCYEEIDVDSYEVADNPPMVAQFTADGGTGGQSVQLMEPDELYQVNWHTDDVEEGQEIVANATMFYRVQVFFVNSDPFLHLLGHVDVQFGANGAMARNISGTNPDVITLNDGRTLPIKFRIEDGAKTAWKHLQDGVVVQEKLSCLDQTTGVDPNLLDCDVQVIIRDPVHEQQVIVRSTEGENTQAAIVTFTPNSVPLDGLTAVVELRQPTDFPSDEIPDDYEHPPFVSVELYDQNGVEYEDPLTGDGLRLAMCYDGEVPPDLDSRAIYKVDEGETPQTVLLETGIGSDCLSLFALAPPPQSDESFLGRLQDGLSRVASLLEPDPLKASVGGVNTLRPVRRLSEFGQTTLTLDAAVGDGSAGTPTKITAQVWQDDGSPVGGVGGVFVGPSTEPDDNIVTVEVTGGPNAGAEVIGPAFDPVTGTYTAWYVPKDAGTDEITVTLGTKVPQAETLYSQVVGTGTLDVAYAPLDPDATAPQTLTVQSYDGGGNGEGAGVTFTSGALPSTLPPGVETVAAVVTLIDYPPSPEIDDNFEIGPWVSVELYDQNGDEYDTDANPLGDSDPLQGAFIDICYDLPTGDPDLDNRAIYKVDEGETPQTVLLETGSDAACGWLTPSGSASASAPQSDDSFLGRLQYGLSRVASFLQPDPLKASVGGVNTLRPVRRLSKFGQVNLTLDASVDDGAAGTPTKITAQAWQDDESAVGGVGGVYVGPSTEPDDNIVTVEVTGGPNAGAEVIGPAFDPVTGTYTAWYVPEEVGSDEITVTLGTKVPQTPMLPSTVTGTGTLDVAYAPLDPDATAPQTLTVQSYDGGGNGEGAGVTFTTGALPSTLPPGVETVAAVVRLIDYPPSPEIDDIYEIGPWVSVELYDQNGDEYDTDANPLGGSDPLQGAFLEICYDLPTGDPALENRAIYKVDEGDTPQTVLLETGSDAVCGWLTSSASAPAPQSDESFLGRLQYGLSRVASFLEPDPLKASVGGVNTLRPVRRLSEFGQVNLSVFASEVGDGAVGTETEITFEVRQDDGSPVGGHTDGGGLFVGPGDDQDTFVEVTIAGANAGETVTIDEFNPAGDGTYTARYTPTTVGLDQITVTVGTYSPQSTTVDSEVFESTGTLTGTLEVSVLTSSGSPITGVNVLLEGTTFAGTTDGAGVATISDLPVNTAFTVTDGVVSRGVILKVPGATVHRVLQRGLDVSAGWGTATIDGVATSGEWDNAGILAIPVDGGTVDVFFMNDAQNLYMRLDAATDASIVFTFDGNGDGLQDDNWLFRYDVAVPYISDSHYRCPEDPLEPCNAVLGSGEHHGAVSHGSVVEMTHPLRSGYVDLLYPESVGDISLFPGETVPVFIHSAPCSFDYPEIIPRLEYPDGVGCGQQQGLPFFDLTTAPGEPGGISILDVSWNAPMEIGVPQLTIGPSDDTYQVDLWNGTGTTYDLSVQGIIQQGTPPWNGDTGYERGAGGYALQCPGEADGSLPPGSCFDIRDRVFNVSLNPTWTWQEGPATARIELRDGVGATVAWYEQEVNLVAPPPGSVSGEVTVEGSGVGGVVMHLSPRSAYPNPVMSLTTQGDGTYFFPSVFVDMYTVSVNFPAASFPSPTQDVTVQSGATSIANFTGTWIKQATVYGVVTDGANPLPGLTVALTGGVLSYNLTTLTDANGQYNFVDLPIGWYTVSVDGQSQSVYVGVGVDVEVNFPAPVS